MTGPVQPDQATQARVSALVARFTHIGEERMRDLPIYHHALHVEAVGFQPWEDGSIGVLITPWFMNVMLLAGNKNRWRSLGVGEKVVQKLPSGEHEFVVGEDEALGVYLFRSLASPMFRFKTQAQARNAAVVALQRLMTAAAAGEESETSKDGKQIDAPGGQDLGRRAFLRRLLPDGSAEDTSG